MDGNFFGVRLGVLVGVACLAACSASSSFDPASHQQQAKVDIVEALLPAPGTPWFGDAPGAACADRAHAVVASLSVSRQGDIVIAGHFDGRADFGAGPLDPSGGSSFVAAFTPSGHIRWSRAVAADNIAVTYDGVGNVDVLHGAYDVVNVPGGTAAIDQFGGDGSPRWTREVDPAPDKDHEGIALAVQPDNSVTVSVPGRLVHLDRAGSHWDRV